VYEDLEPYPFVERPVAKSSSSVMKASDCQSCWRKLDGKALAQSFLGIAVPANGTPASNVILGPGRVEAEELVKGGRTVGETSGMSVTALR
jgi:hypothetical protein